MKQRDEMTIADWSAEIEHLEALLEDRERTLQDEFDRGRIRDWRMRDWDIPMEGYERDASGFYS
jgi:hypothetical protein